MPGKITKHELSPELAKEIEDSYIQPSIVIIESETPAGERDKGKMYFNVTTKYTQS